MTEEGSTTEQEQEERHTGSVMPFLVTDTQQSADDSYLSSHPRAMRTLDKL